MVTRDAHGQFFVRPRPFDFHPRRARRADALKDLTGVATRSPSGQLQPIMSVRGHAFFEEFSPKA